LPVHFLHTVLAALLHQRGCLVLHASAVLMNGGADVVSGETGAGKSTLLAALAAKGFPVVSDDVTAVRALPGGGIEVIPGPQWIHLCEDAAARLSLQSTGPPAGGPWTRSWNAS
jgi:serine kinase of HPr protein (carbohydrate metabolism regulator)